MSQSLIHGELYMNTVSSNLTDKSAYKSWLCVLCGFEYHEAHGLPDHGIAAGTRWEDVPEDWICPECGDSKVDFSMIEL